MKNPYKVPPFSAGKSEPTKRYFWWSWHPNYPYWSKSCWGGKTKKEALNILNEPTCGLDVYHNKLILEEGGKYIEVADIPCKRLDVWQRIAKDEFKWRKPTDAQPIKGWDKDK